MTFHEANEYLRSLLGEQRSPHVPSRLDRFRTLVRELGSPQLRYPTIHVAGTSGKGSTSTMIAAAMRDFGERVGLHTKPHLHSITERIRIDENEIGEARFAALLGEMMPAIERTASLHGQPSYYEVTLALAFLEFAIVGVDVAVIEAGVGGRLDGTNVVAPSVCVITNVSFDHMDILGPTIRDIARDKAGIAKYGVPLVSDARHIDAAQEIRCACELVGAPFVSVADTTSIEVRSGERGLERIVVETPTERYDLSLRVLGPFQHRNAATAICALEQLPDGLRPSRHAVETAMARISIPGRMEVREGAPPVVFDIAHNPDKGEPARESSPPHVPGLRLHDGSGGRRGERRAGDAGRIQTAVGELRLHVVRCARTRIARGFGPGPVGTRSWSFGPRRGRPGRSATDGDRTLCGRRNRRDRLDFHRRHAA